MDPFGNIFGLTRGGHTLAVQLTASQMSLPDLLWLSVDEVSRLKLGDAWAQIAVHLTSGESTIASQELFDTLNSLHLPEDWVNHYPLAKHAMNAILGEFLTRYNATTHGFLMAMQTASGQSMTALSRSVCKKQQMKLHSIAPEMVRDMHFDPNSLLDHTMPYEDLAKRIGRVMYKNNDAVMEHLGLKYYTMGPTTWTDVVFKVITRHFYGFTPSADAQTRIRTELVSAVREKVT
jgi:hypothetical protein